MLDYWEAQPTARSIDHDFTAVSDEFERTPHCLESHLLASRYDVGGQAIKLRDVVDAQIIVTTDFDDLPIISGECQCWCQRNGSGK